VPVGVQGERRGFTSVVGVELTRDPFAWTHPERSRELLSTNRPAVVSSGLIQCGPEVSLPLANGLQSGSFRPIHR
jgi:hypothetical protein